jgi:hypothetical protein
MGIDIQEIFAQDLEVNDVLAAIPSVTVEGGSPSLWTLNLVSDSALVQLPVVPGTTEPGVAYNAVTAVSTAPVAAGSGEIDRTTITVQAYYLSEGESQPQGSPVTFTLTSLAPVMIFSGKLKDLLP